SLAAVDEQDVGEDLFFHLHAAVATGHDLANGGEVVDALDALDAVAAIAGLERQAVDESHERGYGLVAAEVGDVHALDAARRLGQAEYAAQAEHALLRIDLEDFRLHV